MRSPPGYRETIDRRPCGVLLAFVAVVFFFFWTMNTAADYWVGPGPGYSPLRPTVVRVAFYAVACLAVVYEGIRLYYGRGGVVGLGAGILVTGVMGLGVGLSTFPPAGQDVSYATSAPPLEVMVLALVAGLAWLCLVLLVPVLYFEDSREDRPRLRPGGRDSGAAFRDFVEDRRAGYVESHDPDDAFSLVGQTGGAVPGVGDRWVLATHVLVEETSVDVVEDAWLDRVTGEIHVAPRGTTIDREEIAGVEYDDGILGIETRDGTLHEFRSSRRPGAVIATLDSGPTAGRQPTPTDRSGTDATPDESRADVRPGRMGRTRRHFLSVTAVVATASVLGTVGGRRWTYRNWGLYRPSGFEFERDGDTVVVTRDGNTPLVESNTGRPDICDRPAVVVRVKSETQDCWPTPIRNGDTHTVRVVPGDVIEVVWSQYDGYGSTPNMATRLVIGRYEVEETE